MTKLAGLNLTIFGVNYRPEVAGIAPYTAALAEHLAHRQCDVTVVTAMPHYPEWRVHQPYRSTMHVTERISGVTVHRYRNWVPRRQTTARRLLFESSFLVHGLRFATQGTDAIIAVTPAFSGAVLAMSAASRTKAPWGVIVQDLMGKAAAQSGLCGSEAFANALNALETAVVRRASQVAVVAPEFGRHLVSAGVSPDRICLLPNWVHIPPPTMDRNAVRARHGWSVTDEIVLHAGNMGKKQGLESVIAAARMSLTARPNLRMVLLGDGSQRKNLERLAADLPNVSLLPPVPTGEFSDTLRAADVLLVNQLPTNVDMSLPSKLTSYFAAGVPVVAAVVDDGLTATEVRRSGGGLVVDPADPRALIDGASQLLDDGPFAQTLRENGKRYAESALVSELALSRIESFVLSIVEGRRVTPSNRADWRGDAPGRFTDWK